MKILVFGGSGMLGHKLWQVLNPKHDVFVTTRRNFQAYAGWGLFDNQHLIEGVKAEQAENVIKVIASIHPDVVVNCIGIVKQSELAKNPISSITVNSLFPHQLAQICCNNGIRLIHISTDCVFSGKKGNYVETDISDAEDLYGRTKFLGEVDYPGCLTIRTSMIGREIETSNGLVDWFFTQKGGNVNGYARAIFSGFTTNVLSEIISTIISKHPELRGVWQIAAEPINKYDLLVLLDQVYRLGTKITKDEKVNINRSLDGTRYHQVTGFIPPTWHDMIGQMYQDTTPYDKLRRYNVNQ
jgi:dTDP-4-dehydrorhamnose reductase